MKYLLVGIIVLYRRLLSGRGRFARMRCSFEACESCSAYGLRRARQARGFFAALRDIRARLRRCREVALYADGRYLAWGRLHELAPAEIDRQLEAAGELPPARALALRGRAAVARYSGAPREAADCLARADRLAPAPTRLIVRSSRALRGRRRRRDRRRVEALLASGRFARPYCSPTTSNPVPSGPRRSVSCRSPALQAISRSGTAP